MLHHPFRWLHLLKAEATAQARCNCSGLGSVSKVSAHWKFIHGVFICDFLNSTWIYVKTDLLQGICCRFVALRCSTS